MSRNKHYRVGQPRRGKLKAALLIAGVATLLAAVIFLVPGLRKRAVAPAQPSQKEAMESGSAFTSVEGRYLFNGTIVLARAVERVAGKDYSQPFSQLSTLHPEQYDAWLADLECPVTTNNVSYQQQIDNLVFNCRPEWLPEFSKHFQLVNLANNHTNDMGADGFVETQKHLREAGIQTIGNYTPKVAKDVCEVIALPVRIRKSDDTVTKGTLPIAFCAWHYFSFQPEEGQMEVLQRYAKTMPVFAFMHAGVEYLPTAGADQTAIGHKLIDLGSEFVIGNSPHWVQNAEAYKGKLIAYSTGNFIFDQLDYETQRGLSIDTTIEVAYDDNTSKWLALGDTCKQAYDTCLEEAEKQGLKKLDLKLTHIPVASSGGNRKVTKLGDATLQKSVEDRLNWTVVKKGLQ